MNRWWQLSINAVVYGALLWFAYQAIVVDRDLWFGFVLVFVLLVAILLSLAPGVRTSRTSPGTYPFED